MSDSTMRSLAILLPDLRGGGAETLRVRLADAFASRGIEVEFWLSALVGDLVDRAGSRHKLIDLRAARVRSLYRPLLQTWARRNPDAVIADMWPGTAIAAACRWWLPRDRVHSRLVVCDHNTMSLKPECQGILRKQVLSKSIRALYPHADARIAVSSGVADDLAEISGLRRDDFQVIYNPGFESVTTTPLEDPWPDADLKLLCVGSMKEQKGFALAIEMLAKLNDPDAVLAIVGEGSLRGDLEELARRLGVSGQVLMPGFSDNVHPWYAYADIFCLTSNWEGFGIVIVEAMQYGTQVVSTNCKSGPAEILANGKHGRLVPVGDAQAFANAIRQTQRSPIAPDQLRERAAVFDIDSVVDQYMKVLFRPRREEGSPQ